MKKIYLIAAVAALLSGFLLYRYLQPAEEPESAEEPPVVLAEVITAAADIPAYTEITADMLTLQAFPEGYVPAGAAREAEEVLGLVSDGTILAGQLLYTASLRPAQEAVPGLSYTIPEGMRAYTIEVDTGAGVAGYLLKGDHIDLLFYLRTAETDDEAAAAIEDITAQKVLQPYILQDVEILELGLVNEESGSLYSYLTLALTPEQVSGLYLVRSLYNEGYASAFTAVLRPRDDTEILAYGEVIDFESAFADSQ